MVIDILVNKWDLLELYKSWVALLYHSWGVNFPRSGEQ